MYVEDLEKMFKRDLEHMWKSDSGLIGNVNAIAYSEQIEDIL